MARITDQIQVGQNVELRALEYGYQIVVLAAEQPGQSITEIAPGHVIFENATEGVQTRVPMHLLRSVAPAGTPVPQAA